MSKKKNYKPKQANIKKLKLFLKKYNDGRDKSN